MFCKGQGIICFQGISEALVIKTLFRGIKFPIDNRQESTPIILPAYQLLQKPQIEALRWMTTSNAIRRLFLASYNLGKFVVDTKSLTLFSGRLFQIPKTT
jgi:hypothetical protein